MSKKSPSYIKNRFKIGSVWKAQTKNIYCIFTILDYMQLEYFEPRVGIKVVLYANASNNKPNDAYFKLGSRIVIDVDKLLTCKKVFKEKAKGQ